MKLLVWTKFLFTFAKNWKFSVVLQITSEITSQDSYDLKYGKSCACSHCLGTWMSLCPFHSSWYLSAHSDCVTAGGSSNCEQEEVRGVVVVCTVIK